MVVAFFAVVISGRRMVTSPVKPKHCAMTEGTFFESDHAAN